MTFSLTARCAQTGMFGVVVTSSSVCVAARCAWVRGQVGAVASQNITDPTLGHLGLDLMARGMSAPATLKALVSSAPHIAFRQLVLIDAQGRTAVYSGARTLGRHATVQGQDCAAAGNLLNAASGAVDNIANSSVQYSLEKKQKDLWNFIVGSQYQLNKHWMIRAEYGFLASREQLLVGLQYRFGL